MVACLCVCIVQERLTKQIAEALTETITPRGVGVVIEATYVYLPSAIWLYSMLVVVLHFLHLHCSYSCASGH